MSVNIKLKHSSIDSKAPVAADLENGELALNINENSPAAYIKDSNGDIVKLAGANSVSTDTDTVKKSVTTAQNMVGDLTLGTDKVTLDAGTGAGTFKGRVDVGTDGSPIATDTAISAVNNSSSPTLYLDNQGVGDVSIEATGGASFKGRVEIDGAANGDLYVSDGSDTNDGVLIQADTTTLYGDTLIQAQGIYTRGNATISSIAGMYVGGIKGVTDNNIKISLESSGESTFLGDMIVHGDAQSNEEGVKIASGLITTCQEVGSNSVFRANTEAGGDVKIDLSAAGRASFAGDLYVGTTWAGLGPTTTPPITLAASGAASFAGQITTGDGSGTTSGVNIGDGGFIAISHDSRTTQSILSAYNSTADETVFSVLGNGSAGFKGDVSIGDSTTFRGTLGNAVALLPPTITEQFETIISNLPVAQPFTGDATTLPADIPTPLKDALVRATTAGKINLNANDGSASFATGAFQVDGLGIIQTNVFTVGNIKINSSADFDDPKISLSASTGSAAFAGDVTVGENTSGSAAFDKDGTYVGKEGYISFYKTQADTSSGFISGRRFGTTDPLFSIDAAGAATFASRGTFGSYVSTSEYFVSNSVTNGIAGLYAYNATGALRTDSALIISNSNSSSYTTIDLKYDGSASFNGDLLVGETPSLGSNAGVKIYSAQGSIEITGDSAGQNLLLGYKQGTATNTVSITAGGEATFVGDPSGGANNGFQIRDTGEVLIKSGATDGLTIYGSGSIKAVRLVSSGDAVFTGAVSATNVPPSDARFKENIEPAKPQLADVVALGGLLKNYDWNDQAPLNEEIRSQRQLGLIAQEAAEVCPAIIKDIHATKQGAVITPEEIIPAVVEPAHTVPAVTKEVPNPKSGKEGETITVEVEPAREVPEQVITPEKVIPATYEVLDDSYKGISQEALIMKLIGAVAELSAEVTALKAVKTTKK